MSTNVQRLKFAIRRDAKAYLRWSRARNFMPVMLGLWIFHFLVVHSYGHTLNKLMVPFVGLPLGFYLVVQASLVVFVVMLLWFAKAELTNRH